MCCSLFFEVTVATASSSDCLCVPFCDMNLSARSRCLPPCNFARHAVRIGPTVLHITHTKGPCFAKICCKAEDVKLRNTALASPPIALAIESTVRSLRSHRRSHYTALAFSLCRYTMCETVRALRRAGGGLMS
jgi:hypothetical protein